MCIEIIFSADNAVLSVESYPTFRRDKQHANLGLKRNPSNPILASSMLNSVFLLRLLFNFEYGSDINLRNICLP
jgi:hypothetical protein